MPTSVTRAARLTGTRSAFALRPTRIRLCSGGSSRIESGSAATRSPGLSSGRTELLASGKTTGWPISRSKSWPVDRDLVPFLGVAGHDAHPGRWPPAGLEARRRTIGPCRRRSGCRRPGGRPRNTPPPGPRPGRARRWSARAGAYGRPGVVGEPRRDRPRRSGRGRSSGVSAPPLKRIASGRAGRSSG